MCEILNTCRLELKSSCSCYEETTKEIIRRASNTYAGLCYTGRSYRVIAHRWSELEAMPIVGEVAVWTRQAHLLQGELGAGYFMHCCFGC